MKTNRNKAQTLKFQNISDEYSIQNQTKMSTQILCKINVGFEQSSYAIPIYQNSDIQKLGLKLIVKLYQNLNQQQFQNNFIIIHENVCKILLKKIQQAVKFTQEHDLNKSKQWKTKLLRIIHKYRQENGKITSNIQQMRNQMKYFTKNYHQTKFDTSRTYRQSQNNQSASKFKTPRVQYTSSLYDKAMKSIQKQSQRQTENNILKNKKIQEQCIFSPDISKTQKMMMSKQKKCVFQRLYENANEIQSKKMFKFQQIKTQNNQKENKQCHFRPKINNCSAEIINIKLAQQISYRQRSVLSDINFQCKNKQINDLSCDKKKHNKNFFVLNNNKSDVNFNQLSSNNSHDFSQKFLKKQITNRILQSLFDPNHYENRHNKTLSKLNLSQQNQFTFQPELSIGTQRITKNYPNFDKRMKVYEVRKMQKLACDSKQKQRICSFNKQHKLNSKSKQKNTNGFSSLLNEKKQKKGITKYLARIRTQPNFDEQQVNNISMLTCNKQNSYNFKNYVSEIYRLDNSFAQDESFETAFKPKQQVYSNSLTKTKINVINSQKSSEQVKKHLYKLIFIQCSLNKKQLTTEDFSKNIQIPQILKEILNPLIQQLQDMNTSLDCQQFVWSMQNLYEQLSIEKRAILLAYANKISNKQPQYQEYKRHDTLRHIKTEDSIFQLVE